MRIVFFLFLLFLPLFPALNPVGDIDLASSRILALLMFLWWLWEKIKKKERPFLDAWHLFIFVFLALSALSIVFSQMPLWGARKLLFFLSFFPLYFAACDLFGRRILWVKPLVLAMFFSGILVAVLGTFQWVSQVFLDPVVTARFIEYAGPRLWGEDTARLVFENKSWFVNIGGETHARAFFPFPDPHTYAAYLGVSFPFALGLFLETRRMRTGLGLFLASVFLLFALYLSFSRAAYLGALVTLPFLVFLSWRCGFRRIQVGAVAFLFLLFVFFTANPALSLRGPVSLGAERFETAFDLEEGSNAGRFELWRLAFREFAKRPLFGVGLGNFPRIVEPTVSYRSPINAHNTYLDIAAETGIIALLSWLFLVLGTLALLFRKSLRSLSDPPLAFALFGSLFYFFIHSFFETTIYSPSILPLLVLILALSHAVIQDEKTLSHPKP